MASAGRPPEAALDTSTNNGTGWGPKGPSKWDLLDWLRRGSSLARQRTCLTDANAQAVTIGRVDGAATFSAAVPCGIRSCPNCGPRIAAAHRDDIAQVIDRAKARGYAVRFLTLTLRHSAADALVDTLDALLACWRHVTHGGAWNRAKARAGLVGMVRVLECKFGHANGWHPHLHVLLFLRPARELDTVLGDFFEHFVRAWSAATKAANYASSVRAQDMREVRDEDLDRLAGYVTKEPDIAKEMTGQDWKDSDGHWSPRGLLQLATSGEAWAAERFREYEAASKGRRLYAAPSGVLRAALAAEAAPNEHEAYQEPVAPVRERLVTVSRDGFRSIARVKGFRGQTAAVAETALNGDELVWWLHDRGVSARAYEPGAAAPVGGGASALPDDVMAVF